jgi:membrane fusion protein, heavy metal efflux system
MYRFLIALVLVSATACSSREGTEPTGTESSGQQADEEQTHTLFTDRYEFFIANAPLEAGKETEFLVHLTDLDTYKPCSTGQVSLRVDGISSTPVSAFVPGIFHCRYTPEKPGDIQAEFIYNDGTGTQSVEAQIRVFRDDEELHSPEEEESLHGTAGEIEFLKEQAWKSDFMVKEIRRGPFHFVIPTSGELMAVPGEKQNITAGSRGIVRFVDPLLVQGSAVARGQVLFIISSETLLDDPVSLRFEEAGNRLEKSRSEYVRHKILREQQAISDRQFMESRSVYVEDSLRYYSLAAHISDQGISIQAPVAGTIHELMISDGEFTEPGSLLATLSSNRNLILRADLPQQYYGHLRQIRTAQFRPAYTDRVYSVGEMNGSLLAAGASVAENDHYLPVIFELRNQGQLLEGAFAEVYLLAEEKSNILSVPVTALAEEQGGFYVYVQVTGESYTKRPVETGDSDGRLVEITSGLDPGERVVTRGVMLVKAASVGTAVVGHEHSH